MSFGDNGEFDIQRTSYRTTEDGVWRIDSGRDYADLWIPKMFEKHAEDYDPIDVQTDTGEEDLVEMVEAEFEDRSYKLFRNRITDEFYMLYFLETDAEDPLGAVDKVWGREIETVLSETAGSRIRQRIRMENSDFKYDNRLAGI